MTEAPQERPGWYPALAPFVERDDLRVELKTPITLPTGRTINDVPALFLRFPRWTGSQFVDDFGKQSAGMVELDGEHLFAELAVLRLLEKEGWSGRWVNTYSGRGEVWKFLTEWRDVLRDEQKNRPIEEAEPRQLLARIAGLNGRARYRGCWDTFAWKGQDFVFLQCKRTAPKANDTVKAEQESWLRSALYLGDRRLSLRSFCFVQWDYR
ncbi:MAG TPA: hypothetical protein VGV85_07110 [Longimicrobiaceae bacterium]|nr:hypothetical protein [Longimicrobiaceae bacterium]